MIRPVYIYDPLVASLDAADLLRITERLGDSPRMVPANVPIKQLVRDVLEAEVLLIPTRPDHCTALVRKLQSIALQMEMEVMPVCSFLSQSNATPQTAPGTVDAAPTTSTATVSGQPITETTCASC